MERRHNGGSTVEGVEWRGRVKDQNGDNAEQRKYKGGSTVEGVEWRVKMKDQNGEKAEWRM
jgi:hypothetical protein